MKYLIYSRVSERGSKWSGETSCSAQAENCRRYVLARDPRAVFLYEKDEFVTGTSNDRPALARILKDIGSGEWDTLVAWDMDRLVRGIRGWIDISDALTDHRKGLIVCSLDLDYSTLHGQTMLQVSAVLGGFFAKQNAAKTRDKMKHMARQGLWCPGETPMGYVRPVRKNPQVRLPEDNILQVDPSGAAVVREIFACYARGESTSKLSRRLDIQEDRIMRILKNPVYIGRIVYGDVTAEGKHKPLITPEVFAEAAARLPGKSAGPRRQAQHHEYLLSGHVHCSCGKMMSASHARGGTGKAYPYYRCGDTRCTAPRKMVRADLLDKAVLEQISGRAQNDRDIEENYSRLMKTISTIRKGTDEALDALRRDVRPLEDRATRLSEAIQAGTLGPRTIQGLSDDLEALYGKIGRLRGEIEAKERAIEEAEPPYSAEILAQAWRETAKKLTTSADPVMRRKWVDLHIARIQHIRGDDWKIQFMAYAGDPARVRTSGGGWYPGRGSNARPTV